MLISEVIANLNTYAPEFIADSWDNVGLQVGDENAEASKILLTLDVDIDVLKEALEIGANLVVTHHPLIFKPISSITDEALVFAIKNNIAIFTMHTNLDWATDGINDSFARLLGLESIEPIRRNDDNGACMGRFGSLKNSMSAHEFIKFIKQKLGCEVLKHSRLTQDVGVKIKRVGVCGGAGDEFLAECIEQKCDAFVTSDVHYHLAKEAYSKGILLIDAGHFETESLVLKPLSNWLATWFNGVEVAAKCKNYWEYKL
ncbi:MAG: Nif3-like dinuclear metal center hexameric protein [Clostridiales bacterium]|nr:Nif3-like dinuclear metal center hexameric protein [Clostridiales bacterium]